MSSPKKHIVILTTWFPPLQSIAVNRMLAFTRYLDKEKYQVSVVTLRKGNAPAEEKIDGADVYRIENKQLFKLPSFNNDPKLIHYIKVIYKICLLRLVKNEYASWTKEALARLEEINKKEPVNVVISSFSPLAPHFVAYKFCERHKEVKWIADMRDEMSKNPQLDMRSKAYMEEVEGFINKRATALTTVSEPIVQYFKEVIPDLKFYEEIRNGFDHDFSFTETKQADKHALTMAYAGNFYGRRKPDTFFKALSQLYEKKKLPEQWQVNFIGTPKNYLIPSELASHIHFTEHVSQEESLQLMRAADVNVLIQPPLGRKGVYTGKLFDYLSVRKPILALVDKEDVAAKLIHEMHAGYVADFYDIEEIEKAMINMIDDWKNNSWKPCDMEVTEKLHRKYQVKKLETLIDKITSP